MTTERLAGYALAAVIVLAPLPFGSVAPAASAGLTAAVLLIGALWAIWRAREGMSVLPWREPVLVASSILLVIALVQMAPLPGSVVDQVSPETQAIRGEESGPAAWATLSLHPWATRQAALRLIAFTIAALLTIDLAAGPASRAVLLKGLILSGSFQAVYGLAEFFTGRQHIFGYAKKHYTDVATGTFVNRNHFAGYLEMALPLAIALGAGILARSGRASGPGESLARRLASAPGRELFRAAMFLLAALIMATALASSRSRMGLVSAALALLAAGLHVAVRGKGRLFGAAAVVVGGATLVLFMQGSGAPLVERFVTAAEEFRSGMGRWSMWSQAAAVLAAFPVVGVGLGAFTDVFPGFRTAGEGVALAHAHNDYLEWAAETGFAGCMALALASYIVLRPLASAAGERRGYGFIGHAAGAGLLAIAFHSLADFNLAIPSNALTVSVLIGLLVSWKRPGQALLAVDSRRRSRWLARAWAPAAGLGLLAALSLLPLLAGWNDGGAPPPAQSAGATPAGDGSFLRRAIERLDADDAARLSAQAAEIGGAALGDLKALVDDAALHGEPAPVALGFIEQRIGQAIGIQERALGWLPTSANAHLALGRLRAGLCSAASLRGESPSDCVERVMAHFQEAVRLNPMGAATHAKAARFLVGAWPVLTDQARGRAFDIIDRAAALNVRDGELQTAVSFLRGARS